MLTPSYLLHAAEPAEDIAEELHQNIMNRIIERILIRFGRGDDYILTPLDKYQIGTLQQLSLGRYPKRDCKSYRENANGNRGGYGGCRSKGAGIR